MKTIIKLLLFVFCIHISAQVMAQFYDDPLNHDCLKCHSQQTYSFNNELMETVEKHLMNPYFVLDTVALRHGVHRNFD